MMDNKFLQKLLGYVKVSLAVQKDNYALKMYLSVGFQIIDENQEEYIMVYYLKDMQSVEGPCNSENQI